MRRVFKRSLPLRFLVLVAASTGSVALAQTPPGSHITQPIDDEVRVTLKGNVHPLAQPRYDQGAVPDSFPVERVLLVLQRSPERETALRRFLQDAHTPGSPSYHQWLTPERFGELYGPEDSEIAAVSAWLETHGFSVARVTKGKTAVEFSGSAGQLREAFNTEIHTYVVNGEEHHANNRDPQVPAALAPVIAGLTPINDFRPKPLIRVLGQALYDPKTHVVTPEWTIYNTPPIMLAVAPGDFAVQYDLNPLFSAGINGSGVTIGIIGASNVQPAVFATYRSFFGLPAGTLNVVIDGSDPGYANWAAPESYLDVEVAGAAAPGAILNLYTAADTTVQAGLLLAAQRAVDDDQAPVLSTSYGTCEQSLGSAGNQFWAGLWEQAAAQGQTSLVSAGDSGSAGCDNFDLAQPAQYGLAVNGFGSTPWNVSVGGTDFYYSSYNGSTASQNAELAIYWNLTPTGLMAPATSLLKPIPEQPWNRAFGLDLYDGGVYDPSTNGATIVAGGGGASSCASGVEASDGSYISCSGGNPKPAWQSGPGVPSDGARDLPDVSLFAAAGENDSFFPICLPTDCYNTCLQNCISFSITPVGGTSASAPPMAGIMALINQKYGRQGQANYVLYPLATQHPSVFHDVTVGSNNVPCEQGSPSCTLSTLKDNTNGFYTFGRYYAAPGYDQASGLGSVDANLLLQYWNSLSFTPTSTSLNLSQTSFTHGTPVKVSVSVTGNGGTPSGDVGLVTTASPAENTGLGELTLQSGAASATLDNLPGGQYQLTAKYTGDTVFAPSNSNPVTLNVAPEATTISLSGSYWSNNSNTFLPLSKGGSYPFGTFIMLDAQPRGMNAPAGALDGIATGTVTFADAANAGTLSSGALNLNILGLAEWQPSVFFPVGGNSLSASYSGDASFGASTSSTPLTFTITKAAPPANLFASPSPVALGSATTLTLWVGVPYWTPCLMGACTLAFPPPQFPTGTATFSFGTNVLGTVSVAPGGVYGDAIANFSLSSLSLGTDAVTASYSGDTNYSPVTASAKVVVLQPATLTASANPSSINQGEFTMFTASVTGLVGLPAPTGTVSFSAPVPGYAWSSTALLSNGTATSGSLYGAYFNPGTVLFNVSYSGDSTYGPASVNVPLTITQGNLPPFSLSAAPVTIAPPGATTGNTSTVTVTPMNGFGGAVYLSCALASSPSGAAYLPTCNVSPNSINITGTSTVSTTMTISSTAAGSTALAFPWQNWLLPNGRGWLAGNAGTLVAGLFLLPILARRRKRPRLASFLFVLAILSILVACGGGGGGTSTHSPPPNLGTTLGTYTFTVNGSFTANGVSQAQTTVTVTIQ